MLVRTLDELTAAYVALQDSPAIAVDLETTGLDMLDSEVIGIGLANTKHAYYVDLLSFPTETWQEAWLCVAKLLHGIPYWVAHNAPFDLYFLKREFASWLNQQNLESGCTIWDTMSMACLYDENLIGVRIDIEGKTVGALSLKALSKLFLGRTQRLYDTSFAEWTPEERGEYGCADVRNTYDLADFFSKELYRLDLLDYYNEFVAPTTFITEALESNGICVDRPKLLEVQATIQQEVDEYVQQLQAVVPPTYEEVTKGRGKNKVTETVAVPFNPKSYKQLGAYLSGKGYRLGLTPSGGFQVDLESLEELRTKYPDEPLWEPLFKMRKLEKLQGTYVESCLELAWEDDSVHPEWNSTGTVTGRYSCSMGGKNKELRHKRGPALQTIPRPDTVKEAGWEYNPREWFVAKPGNCFCVADLSQAEVRMLAVRCQDKALIEAVGAGEDIHSSVAQRVFHNWFITDDAGRKKMRQASKQATFGILYGIGPYGLATRLGIDEEQAEELLKDFFRAFPGVREWKDRESVALLRKGYVKTLYGRRRSPVIIQKAPRVTAPPHTAEWERQKLVEQLWQLEWDYAMEKSKFDENTDDTQLASRAVRQAINFEIQGSVAELINAGLYQLVAEGYELKAQIHDEVVIEGPDTEEWREKVGQRLRELFEREIEGVLFRLDVHVGSTWACGK